MSDHPPPWKWNDEHGRETVLWDANDNVVLAYGNDSTIVVASPLVREMIAAAPEMEALLRRALYETQPNGVCGDIHETDDWRERLKALLARIDAAAGKAKGD